GISLHNCMLPHGPDKTAYDQATKVELKPVKLANTLAFMFETRFPQHLTGFAAGLETLQEDYADCWTGLERQFTGNR
ncbi:MAG TPA: homogentisate 1,2-dioxygenase domain-containing protein, partial [Hyphomicrobiaceae bacterium]